MWLEYLHFAGLAVAATLAVCAVSFFSKEMRMFGALGSAYESLLDNSVAWSAAAFAVLALFALLRMITAPTVLLATLAVYGGLRLLERFEDVYRWKILLALGERKVRIFLAVATVLATVGGVVTIYWLATASPLDPAVRRAEQRRQLLHTTWTGIRDAVDDIDDLDGRFKTVQLVRHTSAYTLQDINELNAELHNNVDELLAAFETLVAGIEAYQRPAGDAALVFREAADALRAHARVERDQQGFPQLADDYNAHAAFWDALAAQHEQRERQPLNVEELRELIRYFKRAKLMFDRCAGSELHGGLELAEQQRRLEINLEGFTAKWDESRRAVRDVTEQLNSQPPDDSKPANKSVDQRLAASKTSTAAHRPSPNASPHDESNVAQTASSAATEPTRVIAPDGISPSMLVDDSIWQREITSPTATTPKLTVPSNDPTSVFPAETETISPATVPTAPRREQATAPGRRTGASLKTAELRTERSEVMSAENTVAARKSTTPPDLWTPRAGQRLVGTSFQVSDGGVSAANNNALLNRALQINAVSADGKRFFGVVTYTTYRAGGSTRYWGASAQAHGTIEGDRVTLVVDRAIYVPAGTFLSPGSCSGRIANGQISGSWRAKNGAYGQFEFSLPR